MVHILGNCALILGLAGLAIVGFLRVLDDLLFRDVFGIPSWPNGVRAVESAEDARLSGPPP
jgi:hypothetical protein